MLRVFKTLPSYFLDSQKDDPTVQISPLINDYDIFAISHFTSSKDSALTREILIYVNHAPRVLPK
jgi:hypothetical protein